MYKFKEKTISHLTEETLHKELSLNLVKLKLFFVQEVMCDSALYKGLCGTLLHAHNHTFSWTIVSCGTSPYVWICVELCFKLTVTQGLAPPKAPCETLLHVGSCVEIPTVLAFVL